jgi:hypothetical protein
VAQEGWPVSTKIVDDNAGTRVDWWRVFFVATMCCLIELLFLKKSWIQQFSVNNWLSNLCCTLIAVAALAFGQFMVDFASVRKASIRQRLKRVRWLQGIVTGLLAAVFITACLCFSWAQ